MPSPAFRYVVCDVFTDVPLAGNQLAVFTDAREIPERLLLPLTREMAFSESAFVYPAESGGHARVRIFTPGGEIPFAGHPVLGSAFVLGGPLQLEELRLETGVGTIDVLLEREGARIVFGRMRQPVPAVVAYPREEELLAALGVRGSTLPVLRYDNGIGHVYVSLPDADAVARVAPDPPALAALQADPELPFVCASCIAPLAAAWKTRMFAPAAGVPEDPATGSAAGPLACHLLRHGLIESGSWIEIRQGEEIGRPSTLFAAVTGTAERIEEVLVGGSAVIVARGEFRLPG